eukprot:8889103-Alexandrium_andersonii.AAC.1
MRAAAQKAAEDCRGQFSAGFCGFLRSSPGGLPPTRTPPKSASGALRRSRFLGGSGGAVAPPERSAETVSYTHLTLPTICSV